MEGGVAGPVGSVSRLIANLLELAPGDQPARDVQRQKHSRRERFGLSGSISTDRAVRRQVGDMRGVSLPTAQLGTVVDVAVVGCHACHSGET